MRIAHIIKNTIKTILKRWGLLVIFTSFYRQMQSCYPEAVRQRKLMMNFYKQFIKETDLCFDVGGNLGEYTRVFIGLEAKVICVEPQIECQKHLQRWLGKNPNITLVEAALGASAGTSEIAICDTATTISSMSEDWITKGRFAREYKWSHKQKVKVITLDELIFKFGVPAFCKIDVEGFEYSVLKGLRQPIPVVSFEFVTEFLDDTKKCIGHLAAQGPIEFNYSIGAPTHLILPKWVTHKQLAEELDSLRDNAQGDIYARTI
ncbi:MAG: FkbM family methyltransferase [Planctomycetes bacterium]|nr:FkbM family methyltransferase [Planctomycetota bacterium]